ncbi:hypothetical protein ACPEEZ_07250 [Frigoribacterium sp. 2-23]|uniref:hypothetical protein n=1 Tax=Frigoribacterium sp. 2-23 TaxID=3415006 RepID=UPI003C6F0344
MFGLTGPDVVECSRAGCRSEARHNVNWRNPKIHGLERVKVWSACDEHVSFLRDFLEARDFPVVVTEAGVVVESVGTEA